MVRDTLGDFDGLDNEPIDEFDDQFPDQPDPMNSFGSGNDFSNYNDGFVDDFYSPGGSTPLDKHKDLLKDLTNFDPYIQDLFNYWLGVTWNENLQKYVKDEHSKPTLSLEGARFCINFLKTYARPNNIITHISENEYKNIVLDVIHVLWYNLGTRRELGHENKLITQGDLLTICATLQHAAELVLMGAGDGKYNKWLSTTYSHHTSGVLNSAPMQQQAQVLDQQQPAKPGFLNNLKRTLIG